MAPEFLAFCSAWSISMFIHVDYIICAVYGLLEVKRLEIIVPLIY